MSDWEQDRFETADGHRRFRVFEDGSIADEYNVPVPARRGDLWILVARDEATLTFESAGPL